MDSIRAKRKRYRQKKKKKAKTKERWEVRLEEDLCARWRDRRIKYEKQQELGEIQTEKDHKKVHNELLDRQQCHEDIRNCEKERYDQEADKALTSMTTLLLPTVAVPEKKHETSQEITSKLPLSKLSKIDSVCVIRYIQSVEDKTAQAVHLAKHYRDVAETMRSESIKNQFAMEKKVEVIRGFWRNKIKEGSSRAGIMVQRALQQSQHA